MICGEYPAVQRSRGSIFLSFPVLISLFEVPVFAATRRHPDSVMADLQNPSGRASAFESIVLMIYDAAGENTGSFDIFLYPSRIFQSLSSILLIAYISFFTPRFANTLYACMRSMGRTSAVPIAIGAPYHAFSSRVVNQRS